MKKLKEDKLEKLKNICEYAYFNTNFYNSPIYKVEGDMETYYKKIPCLSKKILRENFTELLSNNYVGNYLDIKTSGSSGSPTVSRWGKNEYLISTMNVWKMRREMGAELNDVIYYFWGLDNKNIIKKIDTSSYEISRVFTEESTKEIVNHMSKQGGIILYGSASTIYNFTQQLINIKEKINNVKLIELNGELLNNYEEKLIMKFWNCSILDNYGAREVWPIGFKCECGNFHISENVFVSEENGELIVTSLIKKCQPLIKYKIGDLGYVCWKLCKCGRKSEYIQNLVGRKNDYIYIYNGSKIHWSYLSRPIEQYILNSKNIIEYYVEQEENYQIYLYLVTKSNEVLQKERDELISICCSVLGKVVVKVICVNQIKQSDRGKKCYFICKVDRSKEDDEYSVISNDCGKRY